MHSCKRLIQKIEVDKEGNVDIYLRLIGDLGLDEAVLIEGTENSEENNDDSAIQIKRKQNEQSHKNRSNLSQPYIKTLQTD